MITEDFYRDMPSPDRKLSYDLGRNPADSVSEAMRKLYGGSFEAQYSFLGAFVRAVSDGNMMEMNLQEILRRSGYCHSNFYRTFKNKNDYMIKTVSVLMSLVESLLLPLLRQDDSVACYPVLDHWEKSCAEVGSKALHQAFDCGYCYDISALIMRFLYDSYLSELFSGSDREPGAKERIAVSLYVSAFSCTLSHFFYTNDRETAEKNLRCVFRLKKELLKKDDNTANA